MKTFKSYINEKIGDIDFINILLGKSVVTEEALMEAVNINKKYLMGLIKTNNPDADEPTIIELFNSIKSKITTLWTNATLDQFVSTKIKDKLLNFFYLMEIKNEGSIDESVMKFVHDLSVASKLSMLDKLNSDYTNEEFKKFIRDFYDEFKKTSNLGLTEEELKIYNRVEVIKDFGNGYQLIMALDENGKPVGFIPQSITFKISKHCGNEPSSQEGDVFYELRHDGKAVISMPVAEGGLLCEAKCYMNTKPPSNVLRNYLPHFKWFLKSDIVKGLDIRYEAGYAPQQNVGVIDYVGYDDAFVQEISKTKPSLMNKQTKRILKYKVDLANNKIDPKEIISEFEKNDNTDLLSGMRLWHIFSIFGKNPFTEEQLINYIKIGRLTSNEICNTGTNLLSKDVLNSLITGTNLKQLFRLSNQVPQIEAKLTEPVYNKAFINDPESIWFFDDGNKRVKLYRQYKHIFDEYIAKLYKEVDAIMAKRK